MSKACLACSNVFEMGEDTCPACGSDQVMNLPDAMPKSVLIAEFAAPTSTDFGLRMEGVVTVGQLEALAHALLAQAQYQRWAQIHEAVTAQQQSKIAVPGMAPQQVGQILRNTKG